MLEQYWLRHRRVDGPSHFAETTQQSPPSIQRAYNTLYITGSSHTLYSVYFEFRHTSTNLSIGGSMVQPSTTLTMFVLGQTQHSWPQSTRTATHATWHPTQLTYNLSPLPSQVPHLGWGEHGGIRQRDGFEKQTFQASIPAVDINFAASHMSFPMWIAAYTSSQSTKVS